MRRLQSEALILDVVNLHDQDRIVTFLTPEYGQKRGVARSARRKFSRFSGQLQLLGTGSFRWFEKEGRELVRIEQVEAIRPPPALLEDLEGILIASYLAEHMVKFTQENEDSALYYRLICSTLAALESGVSRDLAVRFYETWVLRLAGIFPPPIECPHCGQSLRQDGARLDGLWEAIVCGECGEGAGRPVTRSALDLLLLTGARRLVDIPPPSRSALREVETLCCLVRRSFLGTELRSYDMMRSMVGDLDAPLASVPG